MYERYAAAMSLSRLFTCLAASVILWGNALADADSYRIQPGDTLTAYVDLNRDMRIEYQRAGFFGRFERRTVEIHGGV